MWGPVCSRTLAALVIVLGSLVATPTAASSASPEMPPLPRPTARTVVPTGTVGVAAATYKAATLSSGYMYSCAVTTKGKALCWGDNGYGQLGSGTSAPQSSPVGVSGLGSKVASISSGYTHTCAVTTKGKAYCWGYNALGTLGDNTTNNSATPVAVYGLDKNVRSISAGWTSTCAVTTAGRVRCWGDNSAGQLGDGTTTNSLKPVTVRGLTSGVKSVSVGLAYACALKNSGRVVCWGSNAYGELGDNTSTDRLTPVLVYELSGAKSVSIAFHHTCATRTNGKAVCWGYNTYGQLGDGTTVSSSRPVVVSGFASKTSVVKTGEFGTCLIKTNGAAYCWGDNGWGQVGDKTTTNRLAPVKVHSLGSTKKISVGLVHTCAITSSKSVKCWGYNGFGQLGDGTATSSLAPVKVTGF
ncbi:MAG: hypothetical protein LCH96_10895 [Actinobacteria bacterium]|nr:hypothetical protein [Actinomycetota bacterium]